MSTRAVVTIKDGSDTFHVYTHSDGYPAYQGVRIRKAITMAWQLPRFEAMDFGAAFVAANKESGGGIYLTRNWKHHEDIEHHYEVTSKRGAIHVTHFLCHMQPDGPVVCEEAFSGTLDAFYKASKCVEMES